MKNQSKSKVDELRDVLKAKKAPEAKKREVETEDLPEPSDTEREAEDFSESLRAAEEEAKQHYDKLLRVMAEFENFKRRTTRELDEKVKFANERLIIDILPVLDDLDRVFEHIPEDAAPEVKALADGIEMVSKTFMSVLQKFGLAEIETSGISFDPKKHEAMSCIESNDHEDGAIIAVHRKGYTLEGRVIRAAQVTVTKQADGE